ncbi:MAG: indolepyruvate ferredoxin oxidoreductase subunit alpha [Synergistaceae bacterium]|jgi:indolepyruvate ferredoxin oxidoreductase alpha subunit|nr:indolepyruvate ferredoxin oxidoreductase subunit alpha [Synergistaceae bacterium]
MRQIMTGNEAIARGAWEAGCHVAAAYPGTPSSEILENISRYKEIDSEWSTNEKVALEVASGASIAGARALAAMKHVGLNVAADPFFTMSYIGATGGLVVVTADDPGLFSSQNEQDNRWYAMHAKVPMLEPSDSQECLDFVRDAFDLSERFDVPVLFRVTTRICHSKTIVELGERTEVPVKPYERDPAKRIMTPASAKARRYLIEDRERALATFSNGCKYNRIQWGRSRKIGVITSGISYQHAREAFESVPGFAGEASFLKLGFTYPLPDEMIRKFAGEVGEVYVVEENEPYIENFVLRLGVKCVGRDALPAVDELNPGIVKKAFLGFLPEKGCSVDASPPPRPPVLCPGCSHRGVFYALSKFKDIAVSGDIGCYTLGAAPPLGVTDSVICMGAGVSAGIGFRKAFAKQSPDGGKRIKKVFGVIGDSTFFHSGITGLIDAVVNKSDMALCILDNRTTAMTGHQHNPGTGRTLTGEETSVIDLRELCVACGVKPENVRVVDSYDLKEVDGALKDAYAAGEIFVIIAVQPCALIKDVIRRRAGVFCEVNSDSCVMCGMCMKAGCPAISSGGKSIAIERSMCNGCMICAQICPKKAIFKVGELSD